MPYEDSHLIIPANMYNDSGVYYGIPPIGMTTPPLVICTMWVATFIHTFKIKILRNSLFLQNQKVKKKSKKILNSENTFVIYGDGNFR